MEVMNYLTDVSALQAAGADYTGITGKDSPTPQENFKFALISFNVGLFHSLAPICPILILKFFTGRSKCRYKFVVRFIYKCNN